MRMVYFLLHFIATIFINRGLTTALKGEYAYIINIVSVLAIVGGMGLDLLYLEYIKKYGENEWKSHPYLTKNIIYSLPLKKYENNELCNEITTLSKLLIKEYNHERDMELEKLICKLYTISDEEESMIYSTMNNLPDLGAVNMMKVENRCIDI